MNRQVNTIFCDDVRREIGGKVSYIGVYGGAMVISALPAVLPKLCVSVEAITPDSTPFRRLSIRLFKDDVKLAEAELSEQDLADALASSAAAPPEELGNQRVHRFSSIMEFSPFALEGPCTLRVRVETENEELRGLGLRIVPSSAGATLV